MDWSAAERNFVVERHSLRSVFTKAAMLPGGRPQDIKPLVVEIQSRQSRLVVEDTYREACAVIATASELVARRALATKDAFLRFHFLAAAREIAALSSTLKNIMHGDSGTACLTLLLEREIGWLKAAYPERVGRIDRAFVELDLVPSWSSACIFGLIVRIFLEDAIRQIAPQSKLLVRLHRDDDVLHFGIGGTGKCSGQDFMQRIPAPGRCGALLSSLSGRIEAAAQGVTVKIPVLAFTLLDEAEFSFDHREFGP